MTSIFIKGPDGIERTADEHFTCLGDVVNDPTGAHEAIENFSALLQAYMKHINDIESTFFLDGRYSRIRGPLDEQQHKDLRRLGSFIT